MVLHLFINKLNEIDCEKSVNKIQHRGPDNEKYVSFKNKVFFGFNRLVINDKSEDAMQPFNENETWLICNGEIFNWKVLVVKYQLEMRTNCDCEVIIRLYNKFIIDYDGDVVEVGNQLCNVLDGEFAFVIYDDTIDKVLAARDSYGVRPLFLVKQMILLILTCIVLK